MIIVKFFVWTFVKNNSKINHLPNKMFISKWSFSANVKKSQHSNDNNHKLRLLDKPSPDNLINNRHGLRSWPNCHQSRWKFSPQSCIKPDHSSYYLQLLASGECLARAHCSISPRHKWLNYHIYRFDIIEILARDYPEIFTTIYSIYEKLCI